MHVCVSYRVDHSRVADVGPDRAAAEWILRLGGQVKFDSFESWTTDYNRMPAEPRERTRLVAINASGVSITNNGLEHLGETNTVGSPSLFRTRMWQMIIHLCSMCILIYMQTSEVSSFLGWNDCNQ